MDILRAQGREIRRTSAGLASWQAQHGHYRIAHQHNNADVGHAFVADAFEDLIVLSQSHNGWITPEQVYFALQSWAEALTEDNLNEWLSKYDFSNIQPKTVGLILAGNIPLVGFHDFLSVLFS